MFRAAFTVILLAVTAIAQDGPPLQPANGILSETLQRHGGSSLNAVNTIRLKGTRKVGDASEPVVISASVEGSARIDVGREVGWSTVTTPTGRYSVRNGKKEYRPTHSGVFAQLDIFSVLGIRNAYGNGGNRGIVGNREIKGQPTVLVRAGKDREQTFYGRVVKDEVDIEMDAATGLVAAIRRVEYADNNLDKTFLTSRLFSDYRAVEGILLPFRIEEYQGKTLKATFTVDAYDINPVFDRDLFER
jgi:hypothetical protein